MKDASVLISLVAFIAIFSTSATTHSMTIVEPIDTGWYEQQETGVLHIPTNRNFVVGDAGTTQEWRNFFLFDLSSINEPIATVTFEAFVEVDGSTAPIDTWTLFDVTSDLGALVSGSTPSVTFSDLGTGTSYGSLEFSSAVRGTTVSIELNGSAIANMNSANGLWAFGGAVTTLDSGAESIFHGSGTHSMARLVITIPEPTTITLFLLVFLGAITTYRLSDRKRRYSNRSDTRLSHNTRFAV